MRLALSWLTVVPVPVRGPVDRDTARRALGWAPLVGLLLGLLAAGVLAGLRLLGTPALLAGLLVVALLAAATRGMHLDGLADTADGLTASYDAHRSLAVMKSGNTGPAGTTVLVVVLFTQAVALAELLAVPLGPLVAGVLVCVSRVAHAPACRRGVPAANPGGLGAAYAGALPAPVVLILWLSWTAVAAAAAHTAGLVWWQVAVGAATAFVAVLVLVDRATRRLGGVNGDVMGASIEVTFTCLLLSAT